jgi:hypothetical protein
MRELMRIARNQKNTEHQAFYHGSQHCDPRESLAEIDSNFNQKMELVARRRYKRGRTRQVPRAAAATEDYAHGI